MVLPTYNCYIIKLTWVNRLTKYNNKIIHKVVAASLFSVIDINFYGGLEN